jgi:hypothetical protein
MTTQNLLILGKETENETLLQVDAILSLSQDYGLD